MQSRQILIFCQWVNPPGAEANGITDLRLSKKWSASIEVVLESAILGEQYKNSAWASARSGFVSDSRSQFPHSPTHLFSTAFCPSPLASKLHCEIKHRMTMYHKVLNYYILSSVGMFCVKKSLLNVLQLLISFAFQIGLVNVFYFWNPLNGNP